MSVENPPISWAATQLGEVAIWSSGGTPSRTNSSFYSGAIPWFKTGELGPRTLREAEEHISESAIRSSSAKIFPKGSVVLAMYGATIGKVSILGVEAATNQACAVGIPDAVSSIFLYFFLLSQTQAFIDAGKGGAQPNISQGIVKSWPILLPPLDEQIRIVDKLEELLSDLDAGVAELKAAHAKLVRYRQSLLKAAVEGALTAGWRQHNTPEETGAQLLQRILSERRARWEAKQLAKFAEQGKAPPKDWQKRYPEPVQPDTADLPELPEGWMWASVEQLSELVSGHTPKEAAEKGLKVGEIPWFKVSDMNQDGNEDCMTSAATWLSSIDAISLGMKIVPKGTIIFPKRGGAIATNKKRRLAIRGCYDLNIMGLVTAGLIEEWLWHWFLRIDLGKLSDGSNVPQINNPDIAPLCVPIPPMDEQLQIIALLRSGLDSVIQQAKMIEISLKQATAQRKNILRAAFSGQLVPQDPNDEPASALLARIRAQREADTGASASKRGRKAKATA